MALAPASTTEASQRWGWGLGARIKMSQWVPRGGSSTISSFTILSPTLPTY